MSSICVTVRPNLGWWVSCTNVEVNVPIEAVFPGGDRPSVPVDPLLMRKVVADSEQVAESIIKELSGDLPVWMEGTTIRWDLVEVAVRIPNPSWGQAESLPGIDPPPRDWDVVWSKNSPTGLGRAA